MDLFRRDKYAWFECGQGLYPESHGIIHNRMFDTELKEGFSLGSQTVTNQHWYSGEPVSDVKLCFLKSCLLFDGMHMYAVHLGRD